MEKCDSHSASNSKQKHILNSELKNGTDDADYLNEKMNDEVKNLKKDFKRLTSQLKKPNPAARREPWGGSGSANPHTVSADQRRRMKSSGLRINRAGVRISKSRRRTTLPPIEEDEMSVSVLQDLHEHHQTLLHFYQRLDGADDGGIDKCKRFLNTIAGSMSHRNKWIVGFVVGILVLAIILTIYIKS